MKNKGFIKYICVFLILIILFIAALALSSMFSSQYIYDNVKESASVLLEEGNRKIIYIPYRERKMQFDNYTDALMINTAYSIDAKHPLYSAFVARKNYIPGVTTEVYEDSVGELKSSSKYKYHNEVGELNDVVNGENAESFEYARYWHGYLIVLRPLLVLFNITQLRVILTILLIILAIILAILISKKINWITAIIFLTGLLGAEYFYLGFSLQGIFVFIIMMISSIIILSKYNENRKFGLLFFVTGMLTNFFDFLTVPIVTLMMPLMLYFLLKQKIKTLTVKEVFKDIIFLSLVWGLGYGLTWLTKWVLVDAIFNKKMLSVAINQVLYRSTYNSGRAPYNIFTSIMQNYNYIIVPLFISVLSTCLVINLKILFGKYKIIKPNKEELEAKILPYVLLMLVPFAWYALLQNHSYYHAFFTYRNLIITVVCLNVIIHEITMSFLGEKNEK